MHTFPGGLRVLGQSGSELSVTLDLTNETLELKTSRFHIGMWDLSDVRVAESNDGIILTLDDEAAFFSPEDDDSFLLAARTAGLVAGHEEGRPESRTRLRRKPKGRHRDDRGG